MNINIAHFANNIINENTTIEDLNLQLENNEKVYV